MNYYEHHIGDYIKDTAFLSMLEDGAYRRLLDVYYARELPLPGDIKACCRLVRAQSRPERQAVAAVLHQFFVLDTDGYRQKRCDEELALCQERRAGRQSERAHAAERQRRARQRRGELFETLRRLGAPPPFNATIQELEALLSRVKSQTPAAVTGGDITAAAGRDLTQSAACDDTVSHTPPPTTPPPTAPPPTSQEKAPPTPLRGVSPDLPGTGGMGVLDGRKKPEQRPLSEITREAMDSYNASPITQSQGGQCPNIQPSNLKAKDYVRGCLAQAAAICQHAYGSPLITRRFWEDYWLTVAADEFHSGRRCGGAERNHWKPDFAFLLNPQRMATLFDRSMSEPAS